MKNRNNITDSEPAGFSNPTFNQGYRSDLPNRKSNIQTSNDRASDGGARVKEGSNAYTTIAPKFKVNAATNPPVDGGENSKPKTKIKANVYTYDLNDGELIDIINKESRKMLSERNVIPEEEEEIGLEVKEKVKMYSEQPIRASQRIDHQQTDRKSNFEGRKSYIGATWKLESRESYRPTTGLQANFGSNTPGNYQSQTERPSAIAFKAQTDFYEEEGERDYRDGFFCGVCTSRRKPLKKDDPNQLKRRVAKPETF